MRSALLIAYLALVGCSANSSPEAEPDGQIAVQERLWDQAGVDDYSFDFQQQCFCVREQVQPVTIEVLDGQIARVISKGTGEDITDAPNLRWPTVPQLFDIVSEAQANGADPLVVRYNPQLGYPTHIEIGSLAADAGVIYSASNLQPAGS